MSIFAPFSFFEKNIVEGLDPDAQAFLTATGITDPTIESAINNLVLDLKSYGLWTKIDALYPIVGGTATTHKYNLKDPQDTDAAFRLTFSGTVTHSSNGMVGNGTSGYANTHMNSSTEMGGGQNDAHLFIYSSAMTARGEAAAGALDQVATPDRLLSINLRNPSNNMTTGLFTNNTYSSTAVGTLTSGFFGMSRITSTQYVVQYNTTQSTKVVASTAPPAFDVYLMAISNRGTAQSFSNKTLALVSLGYGLTTSEMLDFETVNSTFQTALSR
jgi:hypothetical protein